MKKFVCPVCGYVYEGEEMPADFKCPVCKVPGSKFIEVKGEMKLAAEIQNEICRIIYKMCSAHGNLYAVMKAILKKHGMDIGSVRKPLPALVDSDLAVVDEASAMIDAAIAIYC